MKQISEQDIEKTLGGLEKTDPFGSLLREMGREQPAIADYLYEAEGNDINDDERELLVNFSALAWKIISESLGRRPEASFEYLGGQLERNIDLVEERDEETGDFDESLISILPEFNQQPVLMGFLMDIITDRPDEYGGTIRDEVIPVIILHIKTIVDCLIIDEKEWKSL